MTFRETLDSVAPVCYAGLAVENRAACASRNRIRGTLPRSYRCAHTCPGGVPVLEAKVHHPTGRPCIDCGGPRAYLHYRKEGALNLCYECGEKRNRRTKRANKKIRKRMTDEAKRLVMERAGGACELCGATDNLEMHHIVPLCNGGAHDVGNLILVCRTCHRAVYHANGTRTVSA